MRVVRGLAVSSLVPLLGAAALGVALGYRSVFDLAQFVFLWAVVLCPLAALLTLGLYLSSQWLGFGTAWHFAVAGFLGGTVLALAYWGPASPVHGGSPVLPTVLFCAAHGLVGAATTVPFWRVVIGTRAA